MGHKVHPTGIRLGISKDWNSKWYAGKREFADYLAADLRVREMMIKDVPQLDLVVRAVGAHHERWDGKGYPQGLTGKNIPLIARIISVADAYDAMTSDRAYRRALPHEVTVDEISRCAGTQFDPDVAADFEQNIDEWLEEWKAAGLSVPE